MTLTRTEAAHTFSSTTGGETYQFEVAVDEQSQVQVRNIRSPLGLIQDTVTGLPQTVVDDIAEAVEVVQQQLTESEVTTGSVIFTGETSQAATIAAGLLNNTNYRVLYETPDGTWMRTTGKTTTGFTVVAPSAYGTVAVPLTVDWTVITNPAINSSLSGSCWAAFAPNSFANLQRSNSSLLVIVMSTSSTANNAVLGPTETGGRK